MRDEPLTEAELTDRVSNALHGGLGDPDADVVATGTRDGRYIDVVFDDGEEAIVEVHPA